jgi:excisionase family DNA binding protein
MIHTTTTAASAAGVTRGAVLKAIRLGQLRAERFGPAWAITPEALADWLARRRPAGRPPAPNAK